MTGTESISPRMKIFRVVRVVVSTSAGMPMKPSPNSMAFGAPCKRICSARAGGTPQPGRWRARPPRCSPLGRRSRRPGSRSRTGTPGRARSRGCSLLDRTRQRHLRSPPNSAGSDAPSVAVTMRTPHVSVSSGIGFLLGGLSWLDRPAAPGGSVVGRGPGWLRLGRGTSSRPSSGASPRRRWRPSRPRPAPARRPTAGSGSRRRTASAGPRRSSCRR